jgi:hypothetical protein
MRSFACRRLGSLGLTFRSAPANTTIAQTTITGLHQGRSRSHARLSFASAAADKRRARVSSRRRETRECCGLAGENVRPRIKLSGVAACRVFAERGIRLKPVCVAPGVGWRKRAGVCEDRLAMSNARNDIALTHDNACSVIAPAACLDARAAARVFDRPSRPDPFERAVGRNRARCEQRQEPRPVVRRFGAAAAATGTGEQERAAVHLAVAAGRWPRNPGCKPPRCLKPLATRLEAIDRRGTRAENRSGRCEAATSSAQGRAFCRGVANRGCRLMPKDALSASSGWLRRPG